jgi:hypothetical protein
VLAERGLGRDFALALRHVVERLRNTSSLDNKTASIAVV